MSIINKKLRVFVATPSDITREREKIATAIEKLKPLSDFLSMEFEILDWRKVAPDMGRPQQLIFDQLDPNSWDIFIGVLWQKFGSPTGAISNLNREPYLSGTIEEFEVVFELWKKHKQPRILFYRCMSPVDVETLDFDQVKRVDDFFKRFDAVSGEHPGLYHKYKKTKEFENLVYEHLKSVLTELGKNEKKLPSNSAFDFDIQTISYPFPPQIPFFGRHVEKEEIINALAESNRSWGVIIDGIGGIGKTALAIEIAYLCNSKNMFDNFVFIKAGKVISINANNNSPSTDMEARDFEDFWVKTYHLLKKEQSHIIKIDDLIFELSESRVLLIYDNLEDLEGGEQRRLFEFLRYLPTTSKAIITTRHRGTGDGAFSIRLKPLDWETSRQIIKNYTKRDTGLANKIAHEAPNKLYELYNATKGSPLYLINILNRMRDAPAMGIDKAIKRVMEDPELLENTFREIKGLNDSNQKLVLFILSVFHTPISFETLLDISALPAMVLEESINSLDTYSYIYYDDINELYSIHPFTRDYIYNQLNLADELTQEVKKRYIRHWVNFAQLNGGNNLNYRKLELEWENLQSTIEYLFAFSSETEYMNTISELVKLSGDLAMALNTYLWLSAKWSEYKKIHLIAYNCMIKLNEWGSAGYLAYNHAIIEFKQENIDVFETWLTNCITALRHNEVGLQEVGMISRLKGLLAYNKNNYKEAQDWFSIAFNSWNDLGILSGVSISLIDMGNLSLLQENYAKAQTYYLNASEITTSNSDIEGQSICLGKLGDVALLNNDGIHAEELFIKELSLAEKIRYVDAILHAKYGLARTIQKKNPNKSIQLLEEILMMKNILPSTRLNEVNDLFKTLKSNIN